MARTSGSSSTTRIVRGDDRLQTEALIQLADQNQAGIRGDARTLKRHLQKPVERELKGLGFFLTHRVSPILAGFPVRNPRNQGVTTDRMGKRTTAKSEIRVRSYRAPDERSVSLQNTRIWMNRRPPPYQPVVTALSLIHISEPTRLGMISYAVFCLKNNK